MPFDSSAPAEVTARDRMIQLRDFLAQLAPVKFDMTTTGDDCGTPACICGWAARIFTVKEGPEDVWLGDAVARVLGLSRSQADDLFMGELSPHEIRRMRLQPTDAVAAIDHYLATGEVSWEAAKLSGERA